MSSTVQMNRCDILWFLAGVEQYDQYTPRSWQSVNEASLSPLPLTPFHDATQLQSLRQSIKLHLSTCWE